MQNKELITIGIPLYNMENSIKKAIDSCLLQTYKNFEILIVNDGSKDNSIQIIKDNYKEELESKKIRIYERPQNGGVCMAMRDIVEQAKGVYIAFLDADDTMMDTRIEKQYNSIKVAELNNPNQMVASFCGSLVNDITKQTIYNINPNDLFNYKVEHTFGGGTGHSMYKIEDIKQLGNFDIKFSRSSDTALCLIFLLNNGIYAMVNEPLIQYNFIWNEKKMKIAKHDDKFFKEMMKKNLKLIKINKNLYLKRLYENLEGIVSYIKLFSIIPIFKVKSRTIENRYYFLSFFMILKIKNVVKKNKNYKKYILFGLPIFKKNDKRQNRRI